MRWASNRVQYANFWLILYLHSPARGPTKNEKGWEFKWNIKESIYQTLWSLKETARFWKLQKSSHHEFFSKTKQRKIIGYMHWAIFSWTGTHRKSPQVWPPRLHWFVYHVPSPPCLKQRSRAISMSIWIWTEVRHLWLTGRLHPFPTIKGWKYFRIDKKNTCCRAKKWCNLLMTLLTSATFVVL